MKVCASKREVVSIIEAIEKGNKLFNCHIAIEIVDLNNYVPALSCNGGQYAFIERYWVANDGKFEIEYSTSSDFQYCPYTGTFCSNRCSECWVEEEGKYDEVNKEDLIKIITNSKGKYGFFIVLE